MAVTYMQRLEFEPNSYDENFSQLTKGINEKVQEWILEKIDSSESILEIGCGTGTLANKMVMKGNYVTAIDINPEMISHANNKYPSNSSVKLKFRVDSFENIDSIANSEDVIVSTFLLSELRPFEQQEFLRKAWKRLKPNGRLLIAAEFIPSGLWKMIFFLKRCWYKKKLKKLQLKGTTPLKWFFNYIEPLGFKITQYRYWNHRSIRALELRKKVLPSNDYDFFYHPKPKPFSGLKSQFRIYRCIFTGQVDKIPIEPGIYKSGNPTENSPIIVTANYDFTYIKLMRDLKKINAWVLCLDSNGINVWCAARGGDFGNEQLLEAVKTSGIKEVTKKRILILPQLAAGGVSFPKLPRNSEHFPFSVKYGPVWSKDLPQYLEEYPKKKPTSMKIAQFSLKHRLRAGITHLTFLFRKIFIIPLILLTVLFLIFNLIIGIIWIAEVIFSIILANFFISIFFPITKFTRKFITKGICFGFLNLFSMMFLLWFINPQMLYIFFNGILHFWFGFFSTMSFSGYTMSTNPREIQEEYSLFSKINKTILIIGIFFSFLNLIIF